jgi:uncharacterized protein (TIGR00661 family)
MEFEKINIVVDKKRVLVAPLDWGLGHATRCIPIIYTLIALNFEVIIAADGKIKNLLQKEFPNVVFTQLKGYKISYSRYKVLLPLVLLLQFPKLIWSIYAEHRWLKKIINKLNIVAVVSDNRLGLFHSKKPCIYITHQLKIKTGFHFTDWVAQKIHYFFINKYAACWVPDNKSTKNLAGELSHPDILPKTTIKYLGPLSRFEKIAVEKIYDLLAIISGPEPQRTIFEKLLLKELKVFSGKVLVVRGLPEDFEKEAIVLESASQIKIVNHLSAIALNKVVQQSNLILCRSGYTSIMDLIKLQQKAILIPTPGQTEQEYLAGYLMKKKIFFSTAQNNFSLNKSLQKTAVFSYTNVLINQDEYKEVIREFTQQL